MQPIAQPLDLPCGATLPNRLVKAAMTEGLADPHNRATERHVTLYRRWAQGGIGMQLTGNVQVDKDYLERPGNVVIDGPQDETRRAALKAWSAAAQENGGKIWMQLSHAGRQTPKLVTREPVAPSAVAVRMPGGQFGKPRALRGDEIETLIEKYAYAASVAQETGFDGIQIHAAHGYLLSEFLSPLANQRTDQWGGSLENRARMLLEIVKATREKVGPGFPIGVKLNSADFQKGGFSFEECTRVSSWLAEASVDLLEISGGNYEQPRMVGLEGLEPVFESGEQASTRAREAYFMSYAAHLRKTARLPLLVTGGFRTRAAMNAAIAEDGVAAIGLARPLCVDTDLPEAFLSEAMESAPTWEQKLKLGPGLLGPNSAIKTIKAANGWGIQSWFCLQILTMADGLDPNTRRGVLSALIAYQKNEMRTAKAMKAARGVG